MIIREAPRNVVKHAGANSVDLVLHVFPEEVVLLLIIDNGRGSDLAAFRPGHFGLRSMLERAAAVGDTFEFVSANGVGTHIRVCISREAKQSVGVPQVSGR